MYTRLNELIDKVRILSLTVIYVSAANVDEDLLHSLSRDEVNELFPGPENFLRRRAVWQLVTGDKRVSSFEYYTK